MADKNDIAAEVNETLIDVLTEIQDSYPGAEVSDKVIKLVDKIANIIADQVSENYSYNKRDDDSNFTPDFEDL